jgi:hypothetical protein
MLSNALTASCLGEVTGGKIRPFLIGCHAEPEWFGQTASRAMPPSLDLVTKKNQAVHPLAHSPGEAVRTCPLD